MDINKPIEDVNKINLPGNNFYQYVNNNWLNDPKNQIPEDYSQWGGFTKLYDDGLKKQELLLKELQSEYNQYEDQYLKDNEIIILRIWQASKELLTSWDNKEFSKNLYLPLQLELEILNNIMNKSDNKLENIVKYIEYSVNNNIQNILSFDTGSNLNYTNNVLLDISTGGLSLPSVEYYKSKAYDNKLNLFKKHLSNVVNILKKNDIIISESFQEDILEIENEIASYSMFPDQARQYNKYYTNTTLSNLYLQINSLNTLEVKENNYPESERLFKLNELELKKTEFFYESLYKSFNFREIMKQNKIKNYNDDSNSEMLVAYDGDALRRNMKMIITISENNKKYKKYISYLQYKIIKFASNLCDKELDDEFFDFYQRILGGQQKQKSLEKKCINIVDNLCGEMLGRLFVKKYYPETSKIEMDLLVKNILYTTGKSIIDNDWLSNKTKLLAKEKLDCFKTKLGYPSKWEDISNLKITKNNSLYEIKKQIIKCQIEIKLYKKINSKLDREEWLMNPQDINAYFMPTQNEIVFPAAIFQPPFFQTSINDLEFEIIEELKLLDDKSIIRSANYGGIGAVIAHEITHGFDDQGKNFDKNGNLNNWWNDEDIQNFEKRISKMEKSVERYEYIDNEKNIFKMNAKLTMGENIADVGGLSLSLKALLKILEGENISSEKINANLKIFFKSWANVWKQNIHEEKSKLLLNIDPHAPTEFRGNLVNHIDKFYEVFNISESDPIFLQKEFRMDLW